jgi:hypothetical protein
MARSSTMDVGMAEKIFTANAWAPVILANKSRTLLDLDIPQAHHHPGLLTTAPTTHVVIGELGARD